LTERNGYHWGIDVGGTTMVTGFLGDGDFHLVATLETGSPDEPPDEKLKRLADVILEKDPHPVSSGIGIAGLVDGKNGILITSPNLPGWDGYPVKLRLADILGCPVVMDNDANAFAFGAIRKGSIPPKGLWLTVTLGTGIGGTIVLDGEIVYGRGHAGEFGHATVKVDGKNCSCGSWGCWEKYASAGALSGYYLERTGISEGPMELSKLAAGGETAAIEAFEEFGGWLGVGLANLAQCFDPHGVFLAGGLSRAATYFIDAARTEFLKRCSHPWNVEILPSGSCAGAEGAALMAAESR